MTKDDENPGLVYEAEDGPDPLHCSYTPLLLIHDGGGTCFSYYCLNPIGRLVYEIHNPHFYSGEPWPGGIPEMARHYVALMRKVVPRGQVILGGWSLGGLLSLEMARVLAQDPMYTVIGIVMIDSICPPAYTTGVAAAEAVVVPYKQEFGPHTTQETIEGVQRCFSEAIKAVGSYRLPRWDDSDKQALQGSGRDHGSELEEGANGAGSEERAGHLNALGRSTRIKCPPTILLRARDPVPAEPGEVSFVDVTRHDRSLGWDGYRTGFLQEMVDIPGHHFTIFAWQHLDTVSDKLMQACNTLERMAQSAVPLCNQTVH